MKIEQLLPGVQKNIWLKNYTTFRIGGRAKYFFIAKNKEDLISIIKVAKKINLPFFILGNGSNLLVPDKGFNGLIIKIQNSKFKIQNRNLKFKIFCEAGLPLVRLISESLKIGATGLEWAIGIPGTVGGAVRGNAGAFGNSISDGIEEVEVYDVKNGIIKIFKNKDCRFSYRRSIFKKNKYLIILSVILKMKKGKKEGIENKIREYLSYKKENQPLNFSSAGSIFVNPKAYSAGKLIEKCDLKGKKIGRAQISKIHANFIVNLEGAQAKDVKKLIDLAKKKVKQKFGIILKEEIECL